MKRRREQQCGRELDFYSLSIIVLFVSVVLVFYLSLDEKDVIRFFVFASYSRRRRRRQPVRDTQNRTADDDDAEPRARLPPVTATEATIQ